jgi:hypothetical protein
VKLPVVLAVLIETLVLACSAAAPAPVEPTPNIDATVEAKLAQERAVDATVEARLKKERASQPTSILSPTNTQAPMPTYTPNPTYTPYPTLYPTYTPWPTNAAVPQPTTTPTSVANPTSVPTPTPRPLPTAAPTATPEPGYALYINGTRAYSGDSSVTVPYGTVSLHQLPNPDDTYRKNSWVNLSVTPTDSASVVRLLGDFQTTSGTSGSIYMDNTKWVTVSITPPVPPTLVPTPTPTLPPSPTSTPSPTASPSQSGGDCSYNLNIDQGYSSFSGLVVRFKIGAMWANETLRWQQGGGDILNLTVSSARIPYHSIVSWPVSWKSLATTTRVLPQRPPPHVVVGNANASPGTAITAWIDGVEVAATTCN